MDNQEIKNESTLFEQIAVPVSEKKPLSFFWIFKTAAKSAWGAIKEIKFSKKSIKEVKKSLT